MKSIKNLLTSASLALTLLFSINANAVLITQDIFADGALFGEVAVELSNSALNSGDIFDTAFDDDIAFSSVTFFDFDTTNVFGFEAAIDTANLSSGLEFLAFDVLSGGLSFQLTFDSFALPGLLDVFSLDTGLIFFSSDITLGTVNVSSPSVVVMLSLVLCGIFSLRRKVK